jgi:hypothetical protein
MTIHRYVVLGSITLAAVCLFLPFGPGPVPSRSGFAVLGATIRQILEENGDGLLVSVWVGGPDGLPWYEWQPFTPRPAASALKTALLIEFFAKHSAELDGQLPELTRMVDDEKHPAVAPLHILEKMQVHGALGGSTPRNLGLVMMGRIPAENPVYNMAANVIIADLGGPAAVTGKVHARDPSFAGIQIRRYMLSERQPRDNEATAAALAAVLRRLATRSVPGVSEDTNRALYQAVLSEKDPVVGTLHSKDGDLYTDPLTVVRSGWKETDRGPIVYVVMTTQANPGSYSRMMACMRQRVATEYLTRRVLETACWTISHSASSALWFNPEPR